MNFQEIVDNFRNIVTNKYFCFEGRAGRAEFWQFVLAVFVIGVVLNIIGAIISFLSILTWLFSVAVLLPSLGCTVRRLHDLDKPGSLALLCLIPVLGGIILLVMCIPPGNPDVNQYGEPVTAGKNQ